MKLYAMDYDTQLKKAVEDGFKFTNRNIMKDGAEYEAELHAKHDVPGTLNCCGPLTCGNCIQ